MEVSELLMERRNEKQIVEKSSLKPNLTVLEPQKSLYINKLRNQQQIFLDLSNTKNPSKSVTLKYF